MLCSVSLCFALLHFALLHFAVFALFTAVLCHQRQRHHQSITLTVCCLGRTPLMRAARWGYPETVVMLLENGARVDQRDDAGMTALMHCVLNGHMAGHIASCKALLEAGADVNLMKDGEPKQTALDLAIQEDYAELKKMLREAGAKTAEELPNDVQEQQKKQDTNKDTDDKKDAQSELDLRVAS
eukprot:TRINITY_DN67807_c3_g4_i4.p1 TRINITY_DN67807_c3_g4~~TRINITY_DN67807_c3_g4_i4.p1  ORF type:complete len:184 (+),score=66.28 TRINITY_DN67807_c3_g4_i4:147-698(+)